MGTGKTPEAEQHTGGYGRCCWLRRGLVGSPPRLVVPTIGREEFGELLLRSVTPTEAEGMTGGVRVHPVPVIGIGVRCILEESCTEVDGSTMRGCWIGHVEIDVDLLWLPVRPVRRNVAWCMLHAEEPVPLVIDERVELRVVVHDETVQHGSPESTLGCHVCGIEHDDVTDTVHC